MQYPCVKVPKHQSWPKFYDLWVENELLKGLSEHLMGFSDKKKRKENVAKKTIHERY